MQESETDLPLNDKERRQVLEALEAILASEKFDAAPQMSAFLRYVVEQAADGLQSRIKAFTVAVDALGKPDTFDPQNDPVVRVLAGRLRAALNAYNEDHPDAPLLIRMAPGSYVPIFEHRDQSKRAVGKMVPEPDDESATLADSVDNTGSSSSAVAPRQTDQQSDPLSDQGNTTADSKRPSVFTPGGRASDRRVAFGPYTLLASMLVASVITAVVIRNQDQQTAVEPSMQAATEDTPQHRTARPEYPSIFVSAIDTGSRLENNLNTLVSSVISENENVRVFRILEEQAAAGFWPQQYILSISSLELPDETRVDFQVIEAIDGAVRFSQTISLSGAAPEELTQDELAKLTEAARMIVDDEGPLFAERAGEAEVPR